MKKLGGMLGVLLLAGSAWGQAAPTLPAGTSLKVKLETTLSTYASRAGDPFQGRIIEPVMVGGKAVLPVGTTVQGRVTKAVEPRRYEGKATIAIFPEAVVLPNGERYVLNATLVDTDAGKHTDVNDEGQFKAPGYDKTDLIELGAGTGGGMLIGGLAGGGKGLLIGAAIGGGAATGHWLSKRKSAVLPSGTELVMEVSRPMVLGSATAGAGQ